jgi:integrase
MVLKIKSVLRSDESHTPARDLQALSSQARLWPRACFFAWSERKPGNSSVQTCGASVAGDPDEGHTSYVAREIGILLEPGQRFGFHNFRHSLATFLISRGRDVKTIQGLLRHAKASTTLDLYSQAIDESKLAAQTPNV